MAPSHAIPPQALPAVLACLSWRKPYCGGSSWYKKWPTCGDAVNPLDACPTCHSPQWVDGLGRTGRTLGEFKESFLEEVEFEQGLEDRGTCSGGRGWEAMLMRKPSSVDHVSSRLSLQALLEPFQCGQHHHGSIDPNFCTHLWIPFLSPACSSCQFLLLSLHMPAPACLALPWSLHLALSGSC